MEQYGRKFVNHLNPLLDFNMSTRSVRGKFNNHAKNHKVRIAKEERETGGGGEKLCKMDSLLGELTRIREKTDQRVEEEAVTRQNDVNEHGRKALGMRKRAMETMGETRERLEIEDNTQKEEKVSWSVNGLA